MSDRWRNEARAYAIALLCVAIATPIRYALVRLFDVQAKFAIFYAAVLLTAYFGNSRGAWLALALSLLPVFFLRVTESGVVFFWGPNRTSDIVTFVLLGGVFIYLFQTQTLAKRLAEEKTTEAIEKQHRLEREILERTNAEARRKKSEAQLSGILNNTSAMIFVKDSDGRYLLVNKPWRTLFSRLGETPVGRTDHEIFPEAFATGFVAADQRVWAEQTPLVLEETAPHDDGPHTYRSVKFPIFDEQQKMIALGGIATDITDLKQAHLALQREQDFLRNLLEVQESERQTLCREFHDGLIQYAVASVMALESFQTAFPNFPDLSLVERAITNLRRGIDDGRRTIRGIRPDVLDDLGLHAAIDDLIDHLAPTGIMVTCKFDAAIGQLSVLVQTAVFRVIQEALNNARKYSGTDVIRIELSRKGDSLEFEICDFGCGFDVAAATKNGFGIRGMTERVRLLGGECNLHSELGVGTRVRVRLPIEPVVTGENSVASSEARG